MGWPGEKPSICAHCCKKEGLRSNRFLNVASFYVLLNDMYAKQDFQS